MDKNSTVIADLDKKIEIEDSNLIIVEDNEDTKFSTISELKKCFSGDYKDPTDMRFYSSKKIQEYLSNISRELSTFASDDEVQIIKKRIDDIISTSGEGKDSELVDARDGEQTLSSRLERDINYAESKYLKKIRKTIIGNRISTECDGYIDIYFDSNKAGNNNVSSLLISKNKISILDHHNTNTDEITYSATGFTFVPKNNSELYVPLHIEDYTDLSSSIVTAMPKGKYYFFAKNSEFSKTGKCNIKLAIKNSKDESSYQEFDYDQSGKLEFNANKPFDQIRLIFEKDGYIENDMIQFDYIMITESDKYENKYIPFHHEIIRVLDNSPLFNVYNKNYDICTPHGSIRVEYYDDNITLEDIKNDVDELNASFMDNRDKCGLITNYGEYLFFDNAICETPTSCRYSYDEEMERNGKPSLKVTFVEDVDINPLFTLDMQNFIENIYSVSLSFYIDRTVSHYFSSSNPITIYLSSDSYKEPEMVNYFKTSVNKKDLIQGWNIIKRNINDFEKVGMPNEHGIQYIKIEISKDSNSLDNKDIYFNSIVFNQTMKPTVLLAFNGIYEDGLTYTYPYLTTRGIPASILSNNRTTFATNVLNSIVDLRTKYNWDLGQYGCNPNKELLTEDNNSRDQYLALKNSKEWLKDNLIYNPISYSAPFGNLRPITVPLLKDLGYKIAGVQLSSDDGYCNFFDPNYDFAIPMTLMSRDTTTKSITDKIQYAIDNECCICLLTNNVTQYGDESSVTKSIFEEVMQFIIDNKDKITPMTLSDFYNKCNS